MKSIKSKHVDYYKLYNTTLAAITFCFLYIEINFFLSLGSYLSFIFLGIGLTSFCLYFPLKDRLPILVAFFTTLISIMLNFL